jgi:hypothetical protein
MSFVRIYDALFPSAILMRSHAALATQVYAKGNSADILIFRWYETWEFILPLLVSTMPRAFGLMLAGIVAWRVGILTSPWQHRKLLFTILFGGGILGGGTTVWLVWSRERRDGAAHSSFASHRQYVG